jgi:hypothetical protein
MKIVFKLFILGLQVAFAFCLLMLVYMVFAVISYQGGVDGMLGMATVQPLMGILFSLITIAACYFAGLPIRLIKALNIWWKRHQLIPVIGLVIAVVILLRMIAVYSKIKLTDYSIEDDYVVNLYLVATGWFLMAFCALHIYPASIIKWMAGKSKLTTLN